MMTPFSKILVANRGEIALRVMRTARRLGYGTVAVHSTADADTRHVRAADQAVCIGDPLPAQSYLRVDRIVEAARASGAGAIHPGYGFLAENAGFALACRDAGLVFVGPSPDAIRSMGNKAGAKRILQAAGVPCVPGYQGEDQDDGMMLAEAGRIGFPVMIKATAGGGGRGMRLVPDAASFLDLLRSARSEAASAFGDPEMILERAVANPRHIEIQILGDRYGNVIHLGERDCSVQRRHQKVIEEAPSPAVTAALRDRMGATAVAAAKAIGYEGAGTLEFLLDESGAFYFMEMNTRLQVEHPVTEAVTGLDLVELQLRVARGEPLALLQEDVAWSGHAIEVRLCAEDPDRDFVPQSGRMSGWAMPAGLRVEEALEPGSAVPPFYDSMIAKIISHGSTRNEARERLLHGLRHMTALGVKTNQGFLAHCLDHPAFIAGSATTGFIAQNLAALLGPGKGRGEEAALGAVLLYLTEGGAVARMPASLAPAWPIPMRVSIEGATMDAMLSYGHAGVFQVVIDRATHTIAVRSVSADRLTYEIGRVADTVSFMREGVRVLVQQGARAFALEDLSFAPARTGEEAGSDGKLRASINGRVVAVLVRAGDQVLIGQPVVTIEAMKMELTHTAPLAGRIVSVVAEGDQVAVNAVVAEIEVQAV